MRLFPSLFICLVIVLTACSSDNQQASVNTPKANKQWQPLWLETSPLSVARAGAAVVIHDGYIYMIGGVDGRVFLRTVEYAPISADGQLGEWQSASILPEARGFTDAFVHAEFLYVVGGGKGKHGQQLLNSVARAPFQKDGSLGVWETLPQRMLLPRRCSKVCYYDNRVYALGGFGGTLLDSVEYTRLSDDGDMLQWKMAEQVLTKPRYVNSVKKAGDFVYVLGGHHQTEGVGIADVEFTDLRDTELHWSAAQRLNEGRYALGSAFSQGYLYALGGISGLEYLDSIEVTSPQENGDLRPWQSAEVRLPEPMADFSVIANNDWLYVLGGTTASQYSSRVYVAQVDNQGRIGNWMTPEVAAKAASRPKQKESGLPYSGTLVEIIQADQYTYARLQAGKKEYWIAGPHFQASLGATLSHSQGVLMTGYYSKTLTREFSRIFFVSRVKIIDN